MRLFKPEKIPHLPPLTPCWPLLPSTTAIDLEIGAGAGLHAIRYAQQNPERFLIALERTRKAERFEHRLQNHSQITNLLAFRCDAIHWVTHQAPLLSLSRIFILYPNPYPKSGHANLRWHNMPFMGFLISRLQDQGELILATNENFYIKEAQSQMTQQWGLKIKNIELLNPQSTPRTHFEKKYLARGEPCWNMTLIKTKSQNET